MRKGFSLVEMLVVLGIIAVLISATVGGYSAMTRVADKTKCQELVDNVATALTSIYQQDGAWPPIIARHGKNNGKLDADTARGLKGYLSMNIDSQGMLTGLDKFGIVTPWATAVIRRTGTSATLGTIVSSSKQGTHSIDDHILRYAVDLDGDGIIEGVTVGGESLDVRATAIVWCCGRDGYIERYAVGVKGDDVYSWTRGQTRKVK